MHGRELDHLFICVSPGASEAETTDRARPGGRSAQHASGQGTANRRFFFANGMLELLWVADEAEAQSEMARPTLLGSVGRSETQGASPFG
jgi:hypothetical protein